MQTKEEMNVEALEEEERVLKGIREGRFTVDVEKKEVRIPTWNRNGYTRAATEEEIRAAENHKWGMMGQ